MRKLNVISAATTPQQDETLCFDTTIATAHARTGAIQASQATPAAR